MSMLMGHNCHSSPSICKSKLMAHIYHSGPSICSCREGQNTWSSRMECSSCFCMSMKEHKLSSFCMETRMKKHMVRCKNSSMLLGHSIYHRFMESSRGSCFCMDSLTMIFCRVGQLMEHKLLGYIQKHRHLVVLGF